MKRLIFQILAFFGVNPVVQNYYSAQLYQGPLKKICVPALNCWSCPAATYSCPIGAIQNFVSYSKYLLSFYTIGILALTVSLTGRFFCGFVCPFGLLQDLLNKIPLKKIRIKQKKYKYTKYFFLIVFVFILPFLTKDPWFSKICPAGFYLASIPFIIVDGSIRENISYFFYLKSFLAFIFLIGAMKISRPFCQLVCPVGAIFEIFKPYSLSGIKVDQDKCIKCDRCYNVCPMDVHVYKSKFDCIQCSRCVDKCPVNAIHIDYKVYKVEKKVKI